RTTGQMFNSRRDCPINRSPESRRWWSPCNLVRFAELYYSVVNDANVAAPCLEEIPTVDVLVAGGGNAALCAALSAREQGATVMVLESATPEFRGGNSWHTRNLRWKLASATQF